MAGRFSVEGVFRIQDRITRPIRGIERRLDRFVRNTRSNFRGIQEFGQITANAWRLAGAAIVAAGVAAGVVLHDVIQTGQEFDRSMAAAAAKFPGRIRRGTEQFRLLEEAAQRVGRETEFTASQAAEGLDFLAMAGFNAQQAIAALPGVVNLATAAQMELGEATDIASDSLGAFGLMTTDAEQLGTNLARVNDVLARTSTSANTTVRDMFEAIRTGAPATIAAGQSLETFSAMVGELANSGVKGSEAGTALRNMMIRLQAPAAAGRRALRQLRVSVVDGEGNMRDMFDIIQDLNRATTDMGTAQRAQVLNDIFGARGITAANLLLQSGADRLREYRTTLEGAGGAAAEMATAMRDTAGGDLAGMNSAIEGLKLQVWDLVRGPFRALVQAVTDWVRVNQDDIAGGIRTAIEFIQANGPEILTWLRRVGIAVLVLATPFAIIAALFVAALLLIPAVLAIAVIALQAAVEWLMDASEPVLRVLSDIWSGVRAGLTAALEFVVGLFVIVRAYTQRLLQPVFDAIGTASSRVMERWRPIGAFFSALWQGITTAFSSAWGMLMEQVGGLVEAFMDVWRPVETFFNDLWSRIASGFGSSVGGILDRIGSVISEVRGLGQEELAGEEAGAGRASARAQVVSPQERIARSVSESTSTERVDVNIRDETGRAEVRRPRARSGAGVRVTPSGAF